MFESHSREGYGVLMVDAKNVFNSVNRGVGLWNARVIGRCVHGFSSIYTYRGFSSLWINESIHGTTAHRDPLYMLLLFFCWL